MKLGTRNTTMTAAAQFDAQLAQTRQHAEAACYRRMPGFGTRTVAVIGPKGGSGKTPTAAGLLHFLAELMPSPPAGVDFNPNYGTFVDRFVTYPDPEVERLADLGEKIEQVRYPVDLRAFVQTAPGRVHLVHNAGVSADAIKDVSADTLITVLRRLGQMFPAVVVDTGNSLVDQYARVALSVADHFVVGIQLKNEGLAVNDRFLADLHDRGYGPMLARSTAVVSVHRPDINPAFVELVLQFCRSNFAGVVVIPYDIGLDSGVIDFARLQSATTLAYLELTAAVAATFAMLPRYADPAAAAHAADLGGWLS